MFFYTRQMSYVEENCNINSAGNPMPDLNEIEKRYGLTVSTPIAVNGKKGQQVVYICAPLTMCDTTCSITFSEKKIINSIYREY